MGAEPMNPLLKHYVVSPVGALVVGPIDTLDEAEEFRQHAVNVALLLTVDPQDEKAVRTGFDIIRAPAVDGVFATGTMNDALGFEPSVAAAELDRRIQAGQSWHDVVALRDFSSYVVLQAEHVHGSDVELRRYAQAVGRAAADMAALLSVSGHTMQQMLNALRRRHNIKPKGPGE